MAWRAAVLILGIAFISVASTGCTCCRHRAQYDSLAAEDAGETCATRRNEVYTFVLGGADPFDGGTDRLASGLNEHGFAKVYVGTRFHGGWFAKEAHRIAENNPDVRFAVVGRRGGASAAIALAARLTDQNLPVDSVMLINPTDEPAGPAAGWPFDTVVFRDFDGEAEAPSVAGQLAGIARRVRTESVARVVRPLTDDPAPAPEIVAEPELVLPLNDGQPAKSLRR